MRIFKRRKGKTEYFYLQHSFRKSGKVVTKELYLGKKIPENIEEIKEKLEDVVEKSLANVSSKIGLVDSISNKINQNIELSSSQMEESFFNEIEKIESNIYLLTEFFSQFNDNIQKLQKTIKDFKKI